MKRHLTTVLFRVLRSRIFGFVPGWLALFLVLGGIAAAAPPVFNGIVHVPNTSSADSAYGYQALLAETTGVENSAFGYQALSTNSLGVANSAFGYQALMNENASAGGGLNGLNSAFGFQALLQCTTCAQNTAFGYQALDKDTTGNFNSAVGTQTLFDNTTGIDNTGDGYSVLYANTTGQDNAGFGFLSMLWNATGSDNTGLGFDSMYFSLGSDNTVAGSGAMYGQYTGTFNNPTPITTANDETCMGYESLFQVTTGGDNVCSGFKALYGLTTGTKNIVLGSQIDAGGYNAVTTGSQNVCIMFDCGLPSATASGQLDIQNAIYGTGNTGTLTTLSTGCIMLFSTTCPGGIEFYVAGEGQFNGGLLSSNGITEIKNTAGSTADIYLDADSSGTNYIESANSARNANAVLAITGFGAGKGSNLYLNFATVQLHGQFTQQVTCLYACKVTLVSGTATWTFGAAYVSSPACTATPEGAPPSTTIGIAITPSTTSVVVSAYTSSGTVNTADTRVVDIHCDGYPN